MVPRFSSLSFFAAVTKSESAMTSAKHIPADDIVMTNVSTNSSCGQKGKINHITQAKYAAKIMYDFRRYPKIGFESDMNPKIGFMHQGTLMTPKIAAICAGVTWTVSISQ